jgi:hypothetical protein
VIRGLALAVALAALAVALAALPAVAAPPVSDRDRDVELRAPAEVSAVAGAVAVVSLTLAPATGRAVSTDGPLRIELTASDGLVAPRRRYARRDAVDPAADAPRFELKVRAVTAGDHRLHIAARFWLCGKATCKPVRAEQTVIVKVSAR